MRRLATSRAAVCAVLVSALLFVSAPALRVHALEGGNSDTDLDETTASTCRGQGARSRRDRAARAQPRAHDEIPFPDAQTAAARRDHAAERRLPD
jgi:hypothetical protein